MAVPNIMRSSDKKMPLSNNMRSDSKEMPVPHVMGSSDIRNDKYPSMDSEVSPQCSKLKERVQFLEEELKRYQDRERLHQDVITKIQKLQDENKEMLLKMNNYDLENKKMHAEIETLKKGCSLKRGETTVQEKPVSRGRDKSCETDVVDNEVKTAVVEASSCLDSVLNSLDSWTESVKDLKTRMRMVEEMTKRAKTNQKRQQSTTSKRLAFMDKKIEVLTETSNKLSAASQVMQSQLKELVEKNKNCSGSAST